MNVPRASQRAVSARLLLTRVVILTALVAAYWMIFGAYVPDSFAAQQAPPEEPAALIGDGAADDTDALQQRINAGGGLRLPAGSYRITRPLVVELDVIGHWSLHGDGVSRLVMDGPGPAVKIIGTHGGTASPDSVKPNVWDRQRMPLVDGIEVVGRHPEACGIELTGTMQPTITRVTVRDCLHGIHLTTRNRNVQISDCHLYENSGIGLFLDGVNLHQINVVGCHISYNAGGGIVLRKSEVRNLQIGTCDIEGNMGGPESTPSANIDLDSTDTSIGEVAIVGCTIQHSHGAPESANIRINGFSSPRSVTDERRHGHVTIADNVLSDVQTNIELTQVRGATITGNTMWKGYSHNLVLEDCDSIVMTGNLFDDNPRYHYGDGATAKLGIVLARCTDGIFSGNLVKGTNGTEAAITLLDCRWLTFSGCQILDYDGFGLQMRDCEDCRIVDCVIADRRANDPDARAIDARGGSRNVLP